MIYNPFEKTINELIQEVDLEILVTNQIAEGYYIEYKREIPKDKLKIARSLASLANTYGGWYIVGVETDKHNVATAISGFTPESCHDPISVIRDLVKHYINPVPILFPKVITLGNGNFVLIVYIPDQQETPFVTKDGRTYRRTHDSSDPVPEADRYTLDRLFERGREVSRQFTNFSRDERTFSQAEKDAWLKIYIAPYPTGSPKFSFLFSESTLENLLAASKKPIKIPLFDSFEKPIISGHLELNTACTTPTSIILRQTNIEYEAFNSLSIEIDRLGRAKIFIPLQPIQFMQDILSEIRSPVVYKHIFNRVKSDHEESNILLKFFNIGTTWLLVATLVNFYLEECLNTSTTFTEFQVNLEFDGVWRYVPFYDIDLWGEHVDRFGLPVIMQDYIRFYEEGEKVRIVESRDRLWVYLCHNIGLACGLPSEFLVSAFASVLIDAHESNHTNSKNSF
jgi:hypothetical protein